MSDTWFDSRERRAALLKAAHAWVGTPFSPNGRMIGRVGGVSCQHLAMGVLEGAGMTAVDVPDVMMRRGQFTDRSLLVEWMDSRTEVADVTGQTPITGDILGFRIGKAVHHIGVMVDPLRFVHSMWSIGVIITPLADPTWRGRHARTWRPKP